jgi:hypothetical protein
MGAGDGESRSTQVGIKGLSEISADFNIVETAR